MAHTCPECGFNCHCGGDIDDINFGEGLGCICSESNWGCGRHVDAEDEDDSEEHEEWRRKNVYPLYKDHLDF